MEKLRADATTWVMRDFESGQMVAIKVTDMTDIHLTRWILFFRRRFRETGLQGTDAVIDAVIQQRIVTAKAIYAEATQRGVLPDKSWESTTMATGATKIPVATSQPKTKTAPVHAIPGARRITLNEED